MSLKTLGSYNMGCHKLLMPRLRAVLCRFMAVKGVNTKVACHAVQVHGHEGVNTKAACHAV